MESKAFTPAKNLTIREIGPDDLSKKMSEWSNRIAKRAYEFFAASGFNCGHDLDNWLKAEREIVKPVFWGLADSGEAFIVTVSGAGFRPTELNIYVNGKHLVIEGKHARGNEPKGKRKAPPSGETQQIYRTIELPAPVVAEKARAKLRNCVLELNLPKAQKPEQIRAAAA